MAFLFNQPNDCELFGTYKFGITSDIKTRHIHLKSSIKAEIKLVVAAEVGVNNCRDIEQHLLSLGTPDKGFMGNGKTEIRRLPHAEVDRQIAKLKLVEAAYLRALAANDADAMLTGTELECAA